ncbi:DNA-3-methyladenine glycosylase I [Nakamurella deserti]|uniref:DNA-3-methyladenine glycosylase I n=1 Tax=Nakamurella deserti TaxID=2164074 RepID=UPI0023E856B5|nr:DNA-3-methyladenine glycosylase I [Nakamurella deserti]
MAGATEMTGSATPAPDVCGGTQRRTEASGPTSTADPVAPSPPGDEGNDGRPRCSWATSTEEYVRYHDEEWGTELHGDDALFERLTLEAFQSGLSWITILRKRDNFRAAFAGFSIAEVAAFTAADEERLMADAGIVRNRAKIVAAIANARAARALPEGLDRLLWSYAPEPAARRLDVAEVPSTTPTSTRMARDLKRLGFSFVGPTTAYALMQATGMVFDHPPTCWRWAAYPHAS